MKDVTINFEKPVKQYGNSVALATVKATSESAAESILDSVLAEQHPNLGRCDSHFQEGELFYFAITEN